MTLKSKIAFSIDQEPTNDISAVLPLVSGTGVSDPARAEGYYALFDKGDAGWRFGVYQSIDHVGTTLARHNPKTIKCEFGIGEYYHEYYDYHTWACGVSFDDCTNCNEVGIIGVGAKKIAAGSYLDSEVRYGYFGIIHDAVIVNYDVSGGVTNDLFNTAKLIQIVMDCHYYDSTYATAVINIYRDGTLVYGPHNFTIAKNVAARFVFAYQRGICDRGMGIKLFKVTLK